MGWRAGSRRYLDSGRSDSRYNQKWTGQDVADFISVSVYTGLRISDVSTFHIDRLQPTGEIQLRTTKAGTHIYTWLSEQVSSQPCRLRVVLRFPSERALRRLSRNIGATLWLRADRVRTINPLPANNESHVDGIVERAYP
jgi:hypothetical protein